MVLIILCFPVSAFALDSGIIVGPPVQAIILPSTSCPTGYVAVVEEYMEIADSACPVGYTSVGTADSCLVSSPAGSCIMYAPAGVRYSDASGTYEFTAACPMK